ncbi:MAG TPA: TIGR01212 family radical SAM protein [bacterium]|nr:TIGR01212 family radical SAM protein [bacterium]
MLNKRYNSIGSWLNRRFGERVFKVSLESGLSCPNRDGKIGRSGCIFCNEAAYYPATSPVTGAMGKAISAQLEEGIAYIKDRHKASRFIAYFQSGSSTHAPASALASIFKDATSHPEVVGIAVSTRPDCIDSDRASLLAKLAEERLVWVELGLQSSHDDTLARIRRGHDTACFLRAAETLANAGIPVCAHLILGLPGEDAGMMKETARFLNIAGVWGVKIHNLHILEGTELERNYREGEIPLPSLDEYASWVADFLEELDPETVVHRVSGHSPRRLNVAPDWSVNKLGIMNAVEREMANRKSRQGKLFQRTERQTWK